MLPSRAVSRRNRSPGKHPVWTRIAWAAAAVFCLAIAGIELGHRPGARGAGATPTLRSGSGGTTTCATFRRPVSTRSRSSISWRRRPRRKCRSSATPSMCCSLNGRRIGSNRFASGAALDRYRVERWLVAGRNRLVVELRSPVGGRWALVRAVGRRAAARAVGRFVDDLSGATGGASSASVACRRANVRGCWAAALSGAGAAPVWGRCARPSRTPLAAAEPLTAALVRSTGAHEPWAPDCRSLAPAREPRVRSSSSTSASSAPAICSSPIAKLQASVGRVRCRRCCWPSADQPIGGPPWTAATLFRPIPGAGLYQDSTVRRFRYVAVAGLPGALQRRGPGDEPRPPGRLWRRSRRRRQASSASGRRRSSAPVEHEVWRELERAAGRAVGKER